MPGCEYLKDDPEEYAKCVYDNAFWTAQTNTQTDSEQWAGEGGSTSYDDPEPYFNPYTGWGAVGAEEVAAAQAAEAAYTEAWQYGASHEEAAETADKVYTEAFPGHEEGPLGSEPKDEGYYAGGNAAPTAAPKSKAKAAGYVVAGVAGLGVVGTLAYLAFRR
jgi:hypothetical protein